MSGFQELYRNLGPKNPSNDNRYISIKVERVRTGRVNPDIFETIGVRLDTGERIALRAKKSSSGQAIPEEGGILRGDKCELLGPKEEGGQEIKCFSAKYFHAYGCNDYCVEGVVRAAKPKFNTAREMWGAQVTVFDIEKNVAHLQNPNTFIADVLSLLKPWEWKTPGATTHDRQGLALWDEGGTQGATPGLVIRLPGQDKNYWISGLGATNVGTKAQPRYSVPTDEEILKYISAPRLRSGQMHPSAFTELANLMSAAKGSAAMAQEFRELGGFVVIPNVAFVVGRDSLAGDTEKYLSNQHLYTLQDQNSFDLNGEAKEYRGYRSNVQLHIKPNHAGRLMVVDAHANSGGKLTGRLPVSSLEKSLLAEMKINAPKENAAPAKQVNDNEFNDAHQSSKTGAVHKEQSQTAHVPEPETPPQLDIPPHDENTYYYAEEEDQLMHDFDTMEQSGAAHSAPTNDYEDVTELMRAAAEKARSRQMPRM